MKKNYITSILVLVFGMLFGNLSFGQPPVANNDDFQIFVPQNCPTLFMPLLSNDTGNVNGNTVDLDPGQPGIQTEFSIPEATFQISNGYLSVNALEITFNPPPFQTVSLSYTVQDFSGNTSNVATITITLKRITTYGIPFNPSCEFTNDGAILIQFTGEPNGPAHIHLFKDSVEVLSTPLFGQMIPISGLTPGDYYYTITNCLGTMVQFSDIITLYINPTVNIFANGTYQDYNNDGIVNLGDIINYQFNSYNYSNSCTMNDVSIMPNSTITSTGGSIPSLGPNTTDTTTLTGYAPITQYHINNGMVQSYFSIGFSNPGYAQYNNYANTPLNISDGIKLNAFIDTNSNGIQDSGEQNYTEGTFNYQINSGEAHNVSTTTGVHYLYETNAANLYNINYNINPNDTYCGAQYTVATPSYTGVAVANGSGIVTYNFAITTVSCSDLAVDLNANWSRPRPGFVYYNTIRIKNEGSQNISNGTITFIKDAAVTILTVSDGGIVSTANGFTLDFYNLYPGESRSIVVTMQVPVIPTVSLGQLLTNSVAVAIADDHTANNSSSLTQPVVGSYDPNEKTESHGGKVLYAGFNANDYLTYTICFENTGTAEAINIRVNDMLDSQLDETSVKMVTASHPYVLDRMGSNLNWRFDGINLPPSVLGDEVTGHGYVTFKVKLKPGFALGDVIPNTANIYFDFNPAIVTNTCTTTFVNTLGIENFGFDNFKYYPNPVKNALFVSNDTTIDFIAITSVIGQEVLRKNINEVRCELDFTELAQGVYFVKLTSGGAEKTVKVIKD